MIRAHEVGRAGVYLKGKILVVAAYLDGDRVDARAGTSVLREKDGATKESRGNRP